MEYVDIRPELREIDNIECLREYVETLCKLDYEKLCGRWHYSFEHFNEEKMDTVRNNVRFFVNEFYDLINNFTSDVVITTAVQTDEPVFICNVNRWRELIKKYLMYDSFVKYSIETSDSPDDATAKVFSNIEKLDNSDKKFCIVRMFPNRSENLQHFTEKATIQVFCCDEENMFKELKSNVYMPWGPYLFTPFGYAGDNGERYSTVSFEDMINTIENFIKKNNL